MAKGAGSKEKDPRATNMLLGFLLGLGIVGFEFWFVFRKQWDLMEPLLQENGLLPIILCAGLLSLPISLAMAFGNGSGKRVGDEAERMARGLRP